MSDIEEFDDLKEFAGEEKISFVVANNNYFEGDFNDLSKFKDKPMSHVKFRNKIEKTIFNPPATIIFWKDGDKTVVKKSNIETREYDPIFGFLVAYFRKTTGMTKSEVRKFFELLEFEYNMQQRNKSQ